MNEHDLDFINLHTVIDTVSSSLVPKPHAAFPRAAGEVESVSTADIQRPEWLSVDESSSSLVMANLVVWPPQDSEPERPTETAVDRIEALHTEARHTEARQSSVADQPVAAVADDASAARESTDQDTCEAAPQESESSKPVWEVDRFRWPAKCEELISEEATYFEHAGQKLCEASRQGLKVLAVTSSRSGEGCTTTSLCLARAATKAGASVAMLDADLEQPQLAQQLGLEFSRNWLDVTAGKIPWPEAAVTSFRDGITILPCNQDERPSNGKCSISELLRQVSSSFDLLIVDLGALGSEARSMLGNGSSCAVDAAIVVRDMRVTDEAQTLAIAARLKSMGVEAVGIAENFALRERASAAA